MSEKLYLVSQSNPELVLEAFETDISNKFNDSHEKIAWKCKNNHIWVEKIIMRIEKKSECPKCKG